jgi:hypothetical protein
MLTLHENYARIQKFVDRIEDHERPVRLWSLWDMVRLKLRDLMRAVAFLDLAGGATMTEENKEMVFQMLPSVRGVCRELELDVSGRYAAELIGKWLLGPAMELGRREQFMKTFQEEADNFADTIRRELDTKLFLAIPNRALGDLFENPRPFDKDGIPSVSERFPDASYDMQEAANCLALSRPTACVCHLMRVLEVGLIALASELHIPFPSRNDWQDVINAIEGKIKLFEKGSGELPANWREKRQFYAETAIQFTHFKDAWRNYAMHFHAVYDEGKADIIFRSVREFMQVLVTQLPSLPTH